MEEKVRKKFFEKFGKGDFVSVRAPGRVNLIGDHTDYEGGYVLPVAVDKYIYFFGRKTDGKKIRIYSFNYDDYVEVDFSEIRYNREKRWVNYIFGVLKEFEKIGMTLSGFEIAYGGNIPVGSGLSSSASVEIGAISTLMKIFEIKLPDIQVIQMGRSAENNFVGVNCGIMDQFIIYLGKKENAIFLNCRTLEFSYVPFKTGDYQLLLVDTRKERSLAGSVYNDRVRQVRNVVKKLQEYIDIELLGQVNSETLEKYKGLLEEDEYKRAKHIVEENERVLRSVELLKQSDIEDFGKLLYESHESLKSLYEVSCDELDFIVDFSKNFTAVSGARLTGAGMGGCCIVLIQKNTIENFIKKLKEAYFEKFRIYPEFYQVTSVDGVKEQTG